MRENCTTGQSIFAIGGNSPAIWVGEKFTTHVGSDRGAVTMMGLVNDTDHKIELWIDVDIWESGNFLSHPLVNTATLILARTELERFFTLTGHIPHFFSESQGSHR